MKKIKGEFKVNQSNLLVEGNQHSPLTLIESKIVKTLISTVQPKMEDISCLKMNLDNFLDLAKMKKTNHTNIKKICAVLTGKTIHVQSNDSEDWIITHWISEVRYISREGVLEFEIPKTTQRYFREFAKGYVGYDLNYALIAKSTYTIRIYELAKKWQKTKTFEYDLDELRKKIGALGKSYDTYGNFKAKALKPAVEEINVITDVHVTYEEIKEGKRVVAIKFTVKPSTRSKKKKEKRNEKEIPKLPSLNRDKEVDNFLNMFSRTEKN